MKMAPERGNGENVEESRCLAKFHVISDAAKGFYSTLMPVLGLKTLTFRRGNQCENYATHGQFHVSVCVSSWHTKQPHCWSHLPVVPSHEDDV